MRRSLLVTLAGLALGSAPAQETFTNPRFTAPEGRPLEGLRICVDAGHGGQSFGATRGYTGGTRSAVSELTESDVNLRVALFLWDLLTQAGAEAVMTRTYETRLSPDVAPTATSEERAAGRTAELSIRRQVAEANDCDYIVMIHHNAGGGGSVNFTTVFHFDPAREDEPVTEGTHTPEIVAVSRGLSESILTHLSARMGTPTRPVQHGDYHVTRHANIPVTLVECSFMTNPEEARRLDQLAYNRLQAIGIFEGILAYHQANPAETARMRQETAR
ncbi:MAG: N-acetylmuramoyl-L-alanine amidase [Candidatus Sumerlaeia bacterium]|nr:N-acetylmuramoyl-L-alanine amidase [Candidatus Sumerlaeia bacterium]